MKSVKLGRSALDRIVFLIPSKDRKKFMEKAQREAGTATFVLRRLVDLYLAGKVEVRS